MLLYAHRGSPGRRPADSAVVENTVPAVHASLSAGADGAEIDLRLSGDGVLVVCHDPDLRRLAGSASTIATTGWAELHASCAASGVALARAEQMLTALDGRSVVLELKRTPADLVRPTVDALTDLLTACVAGGQVLDVTVSSFAPDLIAVVRESAAVDLGVRTALLGEAVDSPTALVRRALDAGHDEIHPHRTAILGEPEAVELAHAVGVGVVPWTVNADGDLVQLADLGVDGMITDVPASARRALAGGRTAAA